jgi:hypothetical protein
VGFLVIQMLDCQQISEALGEFGVCESTERGTRVTTHCLYPSFEPVSVFIVSSKVGFEVHDNAGAVTSAWLHGRERAAIGKILAKSARIYGCDFDKDVISCRAFEEKGIYGAILSVANASADAARAAVGKEAAQSEESLVERTHGVLEQSPQKLELRKEFEYPGKSGKHYKFDIAAFRGDDLALFEIVLPHPYSIAAKYLAFSDTETRSGLYKYAIYDRALPPEDRALMSNVADLVSFASFVKSRDHVIFQ